jgi:hypothetical protein
MPSARPGGGAAPPFRAPVGKPLLGESIPTPQLKAQNPPNIEGLFESRMRRSPDTGR